MLGISPESKWMPLRKLSIPDADALPFLKFLFPPGTQTLITLPNEEDGGTAGGMETTFTDGLDNLNCREMFSLLERVVRISNEGASVTT